VLNPATGEDREVKIQNEQPVALQRIDVLPASFDPDDKGSVLELVRNPSWVTPYLRACWWAWGWRCSFFPHLIPFVKRRLKA